MKKNIILFVLIMVGANLYGQVGIGNNLNEIKVTNKNGKLKINPDGYGFIYYCNSSDIQTYFIYYLNSNLNCYSTQVIPYSELSYKFWKQKIKEMLVQSKRNEWKIVREDGVVVYCKYKKMGRHKPVFTFSLN